MRGMTVKMQRRGGARRYSLRVWVARLAIVILGLLAPLLMLEAGLRLFGPFLPGNYDTGAYVERHPVFGHFHVPNFSGWIKTPHFTSRIDINPMGLRDPRTSYEKPPRTFRILALGDSYVEAAQVSANDMITTLMERQLSQTTGLPVQVINGGVFGYGTGQELLLLDQEGAKYDPDLVILFFCQSNDVANNDYRLELINHDLDRALKPYFDLNDDGTLRFIPAPPPNRTADLRQRMRNVSMLYNVLETGVVYKFELQNPREPWNAIDGLLDPVQGKYDVQPTGEWKRGWNITDALVERIRDRTTAMGVPLVIVSIPSWRMLDSDYWNKDANKHRLDTGRSHPDSPIWQIREISEQLGLPYLSLKPAFQPHVTADGLYTYFIPDDLHWTPAGHEVAATAVSDFLRERHLLPAN
jgi:lysophospholipase L1-like esterase